MSDRPLTQQELKRQKVRKSEEPQLMVHNKSRHLVQIQVRDPNADFYVGEQTIRIPAGKSFVDRKPIFNMKQLTNLRSKGVLQLIEH